MMNVCNCTKAHMVATDGGLRHIDPLYVDELRAKGWKVVMNPKRTYFPEHDQTSPHYKKESEIENIDTLPIIVL